MKKKTKGILIGLALLGGIGLLMPDEKQTVEEPKQEEQQAIEQESKKEEKQEVTETKADSKELDEESKEKLRRLMIDSFVSTTQKSAEEGFDYAHVEYNEDTNCIIMNVAQNDMATYVAMMKTGALDKTEWTKITDSTLSTCKDMKESLDALMIDGYEEVNVTINVLNDQDQDKVLFMAFNGVAFYDVLAE